MFEIKMKFYFEYYSRFIRCHMAAFNMNSHSQPEWLSNFLVVLLSWINHGTLEERIFSTTTKNANFNSHRNSIDIKSIICHGLRLRFFVDKLPLILLVNFWEFRTFVKKVIFTFGLTFQVKLNPITCAASLSVVL